MLIELITPLMLATAPMAIDVPESRYDHAAQVSVYKNMKLALTVNGTQTFDFQGKPTDNDSD
jgi:hypothetical protein